MTGDAPISTFELDAALKVGGEIDCEVAGTVEASNGAVVWGIALYAFCSSTLLVVNKVAVHKLSDASFILFCQFLASCAAVRALKYTRPDEDIELLGARKAWKFGVAAVVFFACLLSNTKALGFVNVEAVIVVRSCSPIAVSLLDHVTLGRPLPSWKGALSLLAIAGGAALYVATDAGFHISGYLWLSLYFIFVVVEMVFVKFVVETVQMSTWTRVYYNNALGLPLALASMLAGKPSFMALEWSLDAIAVLLLSCVIGVAISYAGFNLRNLLSATSFTVVGVVCKIATVLINDVIWTYHSNAFGHAALFICILAGIAYEHTKMR